MGYFTRADLPFYFALADAFTVCDNYFCSLLGPTDQGHLRQVAHRFDLTIGRKHLRDRHRDELHVLAGFVGHARQRRAVRGQHRHQRRILRRMRRPPMRRSPIGASHSGHAMGSMTLAMVVVLLCWSVRTKTRWQWRRCSSCPASQLGESRKRRRW